MNLRRMSPLRPWSCAARVVAVVAALGVITVAGCSAIFNPANTDDVIRCDNPIDCEQHEAIAEVIISGRVQAQCQGLGEGGDFSKSDPNKVCAVVHRDDVACSPGLEDDNKIWVPTAGPLGDLFNEVRESIGIYTPCPEEFHGTIGCRRQFNGSCKDALVVNAFGACDVAGSEYPAVIPGPDNRGFDIRDQYCRSFFCDERFVCDTTTPINPSCRECDPSKPLGEGGCAQIYFNGKPSPVYTDQNTLEASCPDESTPATVEFGPLPTAPEPDPDPDPMP